MSWTTSNLGFGIASALYAVGAAGHVFLGFDAVYPALRTIPIGNGRNAIGQRGAENCWNYVAGSLVIASLLNWQWGRVGGPATQEEWGIFWTIAAIHGVNGFRYLQVKCYPALVPMWVAPLISVVALRAT